MSAQERTIGGGEVLESRYRIISEGIPQDLGLVYKAYDMRHDRLVEVLVLAQHFGGGMGLLSRIIQANQAVADLQQPTLIPFEHAGLVDERLYLVRGPAAGRPLADLLSRLGSLKVDVAIEIAVRLCEALAPLHRAGLVHGGLSPYSVLVRVADQDAGDPQAPGSERRLGRAVAVVDAGLLPALRPVPSPPDQPWGRFPYISPEQAAGEDIHPASDVYAIGSLLYEMLSGRPPFRAADRTVLVLQHLRQDPPSLQILVPQVPLPLSQIVQKALAKEPSARYRNASQLAHILRSQLALRLLEPATPRRTQDAGSPACPAGHGGLQSRLRGGRVGRGLQGPRLAADRTAHPGLDRRVGLDPLVAHGVSALHGPAAGSRAEFVPGHRLKSPGLWKSGTGWLQTCLV
jgi:serine/threonine protein kinase